jgi:type II secretory ATPase GspE/PulE/Tfp pilus assembly ATPase PilB-like protein
MPIVDDPEELKREEHLRKQEEEDLAQILSQKYGLTYLDLTLVSVNTDALRLIPEKEARETEVAAFGRVGKKLSVAVRSPQNPKTQEQIAKLVDLGYSVTEFMVSEESLKHAWERYQDLSFAKQSTAGVFEVSSESVEELLGKVNSTRDIGSLITDAVTMKKAYRITRILEIIFAGALATGASDIHFEPEEKAVRLRFRLDGVLTDVLTFDHDTYHLMLSRLKLLSGLKLNVTAEAQDGRYSIKVKGTEIEIRTSVLPGPYAETVVMRVLNPETIGAEMKSLGMEPKLFALVEHEIAKPNGMILTTGPTGSGKTTTLYAILKSINKPETKIITIEDPIEYHLSGIVQTQVDKNKYSFAQGLRSALRQDPDVIMVGEIRDAEVAETAIHAALTGHLVFSTLHTNNAAGTFPRLVDLGVSEKILPSAINIAMAQRLVRKLCEKCKKPVAATKEQLEIIQRITGSVVDRALVPKDLGVVYQGAGCEACDGLGYKGRIGIFEAILMDEKIETLLRDRPSEREVAKFSRYQGIPSMQEDGILKVLKGVTSIEELTRVVDLTENF